MSFAMCQMLCYIACAYRRSDLHRASIRNVFRRSNRGRPFHPRTKYLLSLTRVECFSALAGSFRTCCASDSQSDTKHERSSGLRADNARVEQWTAPVYPRDFLKGSGFSMTRSPISVPVSLVVRSGQKQVGRCSGHRLSARVWARVRIRKRGLFASLSMTK